METLRIGDCVVMNDKYHVSEKNKERLFVVRSDPQEIGGTLCVWLNGYTGAYAVDGLTKVDRMQEVKKLVIRTLNEVDKKSLQFFVRVMKELAILKTISGEFTQEDRDVILATADEYLSENTGGGEGE